MNQVHKPFTNKSTNADMAWLLLLLSLLATCNGEVPLTKQYTLRPLKYPSSYVTSNFLPDGHTITAYSGDTCSFSFLSCDSNLLCTTKDLCKFRNDVASVYSVTPYDTSLYALFDTRDENLNTKIAIAKCDMSMSKCNTTDVSDKNKKFSSRQGMIATSSGLNIVYSDSKGSVFITRCNLDLSNCAETNVTMEAGQSNNYFNEGGPIVVQNKIYIPHFLDSSSNTISAYICGLDKNSQCSYNTIYTFPHNVSGGLSVFSLYKDEKLYMSTDSTATEKTLIDPVYGTYQTNTTYGAYIVSCNVDSTGSTNNCDSSYSALFNSSASICGATFLKDFIVAMYTSYSAFNKGNIIALGYSQNIKDGPLVANISTSAAINDFYVSPTSLAFNSLIVTYETNKNASYSLNAAFVNLSPDKYPVNIPNQKPTKQPTKAPTMKPTTKKPTQVYNKEVVIGVMIQAKDKKTITKLITKIKSYSDINKFNELGYIQNEANAEITTFVASISAPLSRASNVVIYLERVAVELSLKLIIPDAINKFIPYNKIMTLAKAAVKSKYKDPCANDCPGFVDKNGKEICGICCERRGETCSAYYAKYDGCGSTATNTKLITELLIQAFGPTITLDLFTPFCNVHDICYAHPGKSQKFCDLQLQNNLIDICEYVYNSKTVCGSTSLVNPCVIAITYQLFQCNNDVKLVYGTLSKDTLNIGENAYNKAVKSQKEYLNKCDMVKCGCLVEGVGSSCYIDPVSFPLSRGQVCCPELYKGVNYCSACTDDICIPSLYLGVSSDIEYFQPSRNVCVVPGDPGYVG